jgi:hypothetical protein
MTRPSRRALLFPVGAAVLAPACAGAHPAPRYAWDRKQDFAPLKT